VKFSSRFRWDAEPNRLTRVLEERRRAGGEVLDLTESNPTRAGLEYPEEIVRAFADRRMLEYRPAPAGMREARETVAEYYAARGERVEPERILLTASTSEAYAYLFKLLCDPGDAVLAPRPSYPLFDFLAAMESVEMRQYAVGHPPEEADGARAIVVVNPNNPTGAFVKRGELEGLERLSLPVISDEVFSDYAFGADAERVPVMATAARECLAFSLSGLSKIAGLPQMKLGWIVAGGPARLCAEALAKLEWIADTYLSVSTPVQCAAAGLLAAGERVRDQIRARAAANLSHAREALAGTAASVLPVEGGWYLTVRVPRVRSEEEWVLELLERHGVLVQPGYFFDFESEAYLVASLLTEATVFREGIGRLAAAIG
jgi:aspartate/methionine/tyrosine aminotransferase